MVKSYYCNKCKLRHRFGSKSYKEHRKSANTGRRKGERIDYNNLDFVMGIDGEDTHGEKGLISMGYGYSRGRGIGPDAIFEGGTREDFLYAISEVEEDVKEVELSTDGMTKTQVKKVVSALKSIGVKEKDIEIY